MLFKSCFEGYFFTLSYWKCLFAFVRKILSIFVFHAGRYIIGGFGVINYTYNRQDLFALLTTLVDFTFQQKSFHMTLGGGVQNTLHYLDSPWNSEEVMLIPGLMENKKHNESLWSNLINLEIMKAWCGKSNNKRGLILPNYRLMEHFDFCGITIAQVTEILNMKDFSKNDRRLLVFNASCSILMIIRVASDGNLKDEINECMNDVNMLCLLLADKLLGSGVVVTGLVTHLGKNPHLENKCYNCQNLVVSKEVFESVESFDEFWKCHKDQKYLRFMKTSLGERDKENVFEAIASKLLACMAQFQHEIGKNSILASTLKDTAKNFTQKHFFLRPDQMEIAYCKEKRILMRGDYGSGKTIIALKKLDLLASKLRDRDMIYYIIFNSCYWIRKKFAKLNPNIILLRGASTLTKMIKSGILSKKECKNANNIHLVVDEYNAESLTKNESGTLVKWFTQKRQFKDSNILIAVQPIQINRVDFHFAYGEESEYLEKGYMFGELERVMTSKNLHYVMRNTVKINTLVEITKGYLNDKTNQYIRQYESIDPLLIADIERKTDAKSQKAIAETKKTEIIKYQQFRSGFSSSDLLNVGTSKCLKLIDFDELYKLTNSKNSGSSENQQKISTTYRYQQDSNIGHRVFGPLPKLIKLPSVVTQKELIELIAIVFKITKNEHRRTVCIHFEPDNPWWLKSLLTLSKIFPFLSITESVGEFLSCNNENLVLIVNYRYVRGLEFSNVMIFLDANEYHLKQFIPEAMVRCQRNLAIVTKLPESEIDEYDSAINLLGYWEEVNLEKRIMKTLHLQFCNCTSWQRCNSKVYRGNGYCHIISRTKTVKYYEVHRYCKLYRELSEEIQHKVIPYKGDDQPKHREAIRL